MGVLTKSPKPENWDSLTPKERRRYSEDQYRIREGGEYSKKRRAASRTKKRIESKKATSAEYREKNREQLRAKNREYYENNKDSIRGRMAVKRKKRKETDDEYKIICNLRSRFSGHLRRAGVRKTHSVIDLIGCSVSDLMSHLEAKWASGMDWDTYGFYGWHIDHIKPCSSFNMLDTSEQKACFHYTNLQPLWAFDNLSKNDKI